MNARNETMHAGKEAPPGKEAMHAGKETPPGKEAVHAGKEPPPPPEGSSACWEGTTPPRRKQCMLGRKHPPGPCTPRVQGDTVNARPVRILLECNLVNYNSDPTYAQKSALQTNRTIVFFTFCIRLVELVELG